MTKPIKPSEFDVAKAAQIAASELSRLGITPPAEPQTQSPIDDIDAIVQTLPPAFRAAMRLTAKAVAVFHARLGDEAARIRLTEAIERAFSSRGGDLTRHEDPQRNARGIGNWEPRIQNILYKEILSRMKGAIEESGTVSAKRAATIARQIVRDLKLLRLGKH